LELLESDAGLDDGVKDAVLEALAQVAATGDALDDTAPPTTYLTSIAVAGFRGIGPRVSLDLYPAPGLMVVSGRNGSGKSSFVEALELALTGTSYRWLKKETLWTEAWRNLHQPNPCEVQIGFTREGSTPFTIGMEWSDGDALTDRKSWTQAAGDSRVEGNEGLGWARPLELYRPVLSYDELGRLFDGGPSALYDALAKVLGLEMLTDAEKWLATRLKDTKAARGKADDERKRLQNLLTESTDERAVRAAALLDKKSVSLDELLPLATGTADSHLQLIPRLQALASLQVPTLEEIETVAAGLRAAAQSAASAATAVADLTQERVELLEAALHFHDRAGDVDCPLCGQGQLDADWAAQARDTVAETNAVLTEYRSATAELKTARSIAVGLAQQMPPAVEANGVDLASLSAYTTARAAAQQIPDDDVALADHLESAATDAVAAARALCAEAGEAIARRESAWAPVAAQLSGWIRLEAEARNHDDAIKTMTAAKKWMTDHAGNFRNERLKPIATQARWIWSLLRQESNVDLGDITLEGTATRRRAFLAGSVDGLPTKALSVMSQGELHALALALFIPRATAAASPFRFMVLDDPIQAMDPARIDGFVQLLSEIAKTHQVVVFSHDDRLASVIRETGADARMVEVVREAGSRVSLGDNVNPALRGVGDVFAVLKDEGMPDEVKRRTAPGLFRMALEAAAKQAYYTRQSLAGRPRSASEAEWMAAKRTTSRVALAVHGDASADLTPWRRSKPARDHALWIASAGVHGGTKTVTIQDARDLERTVSEVLALK
jgi:ABC-type lipoprotein export system ATPase subunit